MRIHAFSIKDYRGIHFSATASVPPAGAIVTGGNGRGKTSVLTALAAALTGEGANADAVRIDAERAEIIVDLDDYRVRRVIPKDGASTVTVTNAEGDKKSKPVAWLRERFGSVDPLKLLAAKPAERRAMILGALPVAVTRAQLDAWAPGLPAGFSVDGHGLEVVERAREHFYTERTAANAKAKAARAEADRAAAAVKPIPSGALPLDRAQLRVDEARRGLADVRSRQEQARAAEGRTTKARERIAELRRTASETDAPTTLFESVLSSIDAASKEHRAAAEKVAELREALAAAEGALQNVATRLHRLVDDRERLEKRAANAERMRAEATQLEATLAAAAVPMPTDDELAAAQRAEAEATEALAVAREAEAAAVAASEAMARANAAGLAEEHAERLDKIVRTLAKDAPAALLAGVKGVDGLSIEGDTIRLDGVAIDALCGQEQMTLCLRIAKRLSRAKVLLVDGLEALDPEQREAFVAEACAGGWQLLATLVDRGDVRFAAIEATSAEAAQ